jgi:hypothetical protein
MAGRVVATTAKGTPLVLTSASPGGYHYQAGDLCYTIIRNDMIGPMRWICAQTTGAGQWYSDPYWTKREALDGLVAALDTAEGQQVT